MMSRANFRAEEGALSTERALNERNFDGQWCLRARISSGSSQHKGEARMNSFVNASQSHTPCPDRADQHSDKPALRDATDGRGLLDRILNTPRLEQAVPRLGPELLHGIIQRCGLEDCGELVALATPEQLARVFDLDLWRAAKAGLDEQFDADRFGVWLEVLLETGAATAAQKLAGMDGDLVIAGFAQHTKVYDRAAVNPYET